MPTWLNGKDQRDVRAQIGELTDEEGVATIYGRMYSNEYHNHSVSAVYPERANSVVLTKASGAWAAYPTPTEIVPVNTITHPFDIHFININTVSENGGYTIRLYSGLAGSEVFIASLAIVRNAVQSQEASSLVLTPILPANTRISAALSGNPTAQATVSVKVRYHTY